jgi:hypothetical protein
MLKPKAAIYSDIGLAKNLGDPTLVAVTFDSTICGLTKSHIRKELASLGVLGFANFFYYRTLEHG